MTELVKMIAQNETGDLNITLSDGFWGELQKTGCVAGTHGGRKVIFWHFKAMETALPAVETFDAIVIEKDGTSHRLIVQGKPDKRMVFAGRKGRYVLKSRKEDGAYLYQRGR